MKICYRCAQSAISITTILAFILNVLVFFDTQTDSKSILLKNIHKFAQLYENLLKTCYRTDMGDDMLPIMMRTY